MKRLTVASIQMDALPGQREHNIENSAKYIQQAVDQGAKLILLPEFLPCGYGVNESVWEGAETIDGPSVQWLKQQSIKHNIYLGFTFFEADGEHFYNSFILTKPNGEIAGQVRKAPAASTEAYLYSHGDGSHVIETEFGRIGINICYEILLHHRVNELHEEGIDLCLQPCAAGRPKPFIPGDVERLERSFNQARQKHYQALGVPIIMANRVGKLEGKLPGPFPYIKSSFMGGSYISDCDGKILSELPDDEGVIVSTITIDPKYKARRKPPKRYGSQWIIPMPWYSFLYPLSQKMGEKAYQKSEKRRLFARQSSNR